ncbi:MAG: Gfo/Idh/MocA family oxidoreductase [Acidimicrobiales bacterium]
MQDTDHATSVDFVVIGVAHPHAIQLTADLLMAGAECIGWVDTPGRHDGLFAALFPDVAMLDLDAALAAAPDVAIVASVPSSRPGHAVAAMEAGADVLVAKPAAIEHDQLRVIEAAAARTGRRWWVAFTEHFTSRAVVRADRLVDEGRIGTVRHVLGLGPHRLGPARPDWFHDPMQSGSMLADLASHQIHHAARLLGTADLTVVAARATPAIDGRHPEMLGELMLEGGTGSAYVKVDWLTPDGLDTWGDVRLMITGDTGTIEVRSNIDPGGAAGGDHLIVVDRVGVERIDCTGDDLTWASTVLDDVRNGTETLVTTAHSLAVTGLSLRAAELARG